MGRSYWYLFDSNGIDDKQTLCPNLTPANSVGAILQVGTVLCTSDERLKVNIETIENTLESISNLRGVRYDWKDGHGKREVGVIAQELRTEYPELVFEDNLGFLTVDYPRLTGVLLQGVKELNNDIKNLKLQMLDVMNRPACNCNQSQTETSETTSETTLQSESSKPAPKKRGRKPKVQKDE